MSEREARIARNEAVSREINEGIEDARPTGPEDYLRMVCECGRPDCSSLIAISLREYEAVRADPRTFAVDHSHVSPDLEEPVRATDRFVVVRKREGTPATIVEEEDPRS
ncbi:MAG: hypothetical protein E6G58_02975 [Actinobacteria bacterium]|nr:MAG: hypothetical protein E6G58_02975 [Actinomycetota bacterium]